MQISKVTSHILKIQLTLAAVLTFAMTETSIAAGSAGTCSDSAGNKEVGKKSTSRPAFKWLNEDVGGLRRPGLLTSRRALTKGKKVYFEYSAPKERIGKDGRKSKFKANGLMERTEKPTVLLLHGVEDRIQNMRPVAEVYEKMGWGVLAVDQLGHGRTAKENSSDLQTFTPITPEQQAAIATETVMNLGVKEIIILGHSMGGANAVIAASALKNAGVKVLHVTDSNGYLNDIMRFFQEHGNDPKMLEFVVRTQMSNLQKQLEKSGLSGVQEMQRSFLKLAGVNVDFVEGSIKEYVSFWTNFMKMMLEPQFRAYETATAQITRQVMDFISDPLSEQGMKEMYTKYEEMKNQVRSENEKLSDEDIARNVHGAIEATIGLRHTNFLSRTGPELIDPSIPILYVSGKLDPVVVQPQVEDFKLVVETRELTNVKFAELDGNHFLPQQMPQELVDLGIKELLELGVLDATDTSLVPH